MSAFNRNPNNADLPVVSSGGGLPAVGGMQSDALAPVMMPVDSTPRRSPLLVMWQRRWIIVSCVLVALVAAIVYLIVATPLYQGVAQVYVEQNSPRIIANDPTGVATMQTQNYLWTQCKLITSRSILEQVANESGIRTLPTFTPGRDIVEDLRGLVSATVGRRDDVITITVTSPYAEDASKIANAVVGAFTKYHDTSKRSSAKQILDILQNQKDKNDKALQATSE